MENLRFPGHTASPSLPCLWTTVSQVYSHSLDIKEVKFPIWQLFCLWSNLIICWLCLTYLYSFYFFQNKWKNNISCLSWLRNKYLTIKVFTSSSSPAPWKIIPPPPHATSPQTSSTFYYCVSGFLFDICHQNNFHSISVLHMTFLQT